MLNASIALYFSGVERDPKFFKSFLFNIISWLYRWKFVVIILNCKFLLGSSSLKTASAWLQNLAPMEIVFENCVKLDLGLWKLAIQKIQICATAAQLLQWLVKLNANLSNACRLIVTIQLSINSQCG
ncbi:Ciliated left-right organizer metallopeptidase [Trichinella spiralis]|uniref:Ciliated left-right organizer metallopeptidase n=1 Tax=Trichinella spiralis TaxID=6334 RepID=A0ABR3KHZ9_TRISP